ncbi:MAG: hypothetical protein HZA16_08665 [Nitrospirae bacterium]|nr:hypothetical protein [Nitrospirota bacterium]
MRYGTAFAEKGNRSFIGLAVALIAFLIYADSLRNGFVWDDHTIVVSNPALEGGIADLFGKIDTADDTEKNPYYRPLTLLTFLIEHRYLDSGPLTGHLFNVLLHAVNAFLVYRLVAVFTANTSMAFLAGIFFAVHPISSESVNFISARNNLLAGLFSLSACLLHIHSSRKGGHAAALSAAALFLAGLFCKETALALLPVIFYLEAGAWPQANAAGRKRTIARLIPYAAFTACYFVLRQNAMESAGARQDILQGLFTRLAGNLYIIPRYISLLINPTALSPRYVLPEDLHLLALPLLLAWFCIIGIVGWLLIRGRTPLTLFGLAWLFLFWLPVSGIVDIPSAPFADRYLYLPAIGIWFVMADQSCRLYAALNRARKYAVISLVVVLLFFSAVTVRRNMDWKSEIILFSRAVEQFPDNAWGHAELGLSYLRAYSNDEYYHSLALKELQTALSLDPSMEKLHSPIGTIVLARGDLEGAVMHFTEALSANPFDKQALFYRAMTLEDIGKTKEALADYISFLSAPGRGLEEMRPYAEEKVSRLEQSALKPE